ncbi:DUF5819 family protein [Streptomyces sp. NK08204]|uniref:DUF5819 family protein n=1 Tax=Streptomyces sp. NK08204 TaxID=2873260 RepID=UPI001CED960F|nr:DUF5819 family protein [Streptomyces sp. NK08204]
MDAYDEDSHARPGPDGPQGVRRPEATATRGCTGSHDHPGSSGHPESEASIGSQASTGAQGLLESQARPGSQALSGSQDTPGSLGSTGSQVRTAAQLPVGSPELPASQASTGVAALSLRYQVVAALALAVIGVAACVHLAMVFLSLAPENTVSKQHGAAISDWVNPEFEQNWKLFAPNPLQQNIAVQVRAEVRMKDGMLRTTGWNDLSALDGAAIDGNLVPSHTQQNELRRAWDFFLGSHTADNRAMGLRGALSEQYLRRIVVMRLYRADATAEQGVVQRVQVRSSTTNVQPPKWSGERVSETPVYRELPWWTVTADEAAGGVR